MRFLMLVAIVMIVVGLTMHWRGPRRAEAVATPPAAVTGGEAPRAMAGEKNRPGG